MGMDKTIMLDRGTFTDRNGCLDISRMKRCICYPVNILELEEMSK